MGAEVRFRLSGHAPGKVPGTEAVVVPCSTRTYWEETGAPIENKTAIGSTWGGGTQPGNGQRTQQTGVIHDVMYADVMGAVMGEDRP